jgi:hypothetical protein
VGIIGMVLPPTLHNNKNHPFLIDTALLDGFEEEYREKLHSTIKQCTRERKGGR